MPHLQVVGILVPSAHQRVLIQNAKEWDIASRIAARCMFFDHLRMKEKADAQFFSNEVAGVLCNLIFNPLQRRYAAKTLRYKQ